MWGFPEMGVPLVIIHFRLRCPLINHPFQNTPIYGTPNVGTVLSGERSRERSATRWPRTGETGVSWLCGQGGFRSRGFGGLT